MTQIVIFSHSFFVILLDRQIIQDNLSLNLYEGSLLALGGVQLVPLSSKTFVLLGLGAKPLLLAS